MKFGEVYGLNSAQIKSLLKSSGFELINRKRFMFGMNNLYVASKIH
ncbi:hypothetical protein HOD20_02265 [archaeon]|jgi:hypothetical protein|nr:hypothetical protein [archaeon]MBT4647005.1 hypothetical protein [archaeon]MBT6822473.1 hypothetical protein [archaeon]MBT7392002.1 hypothetical protein [archaeon]